MCSFRAILRAIVLLITASQVSCVYSVNPLAAPEKCTIDERLVGVWKEVGKEETTYVFIGRPRDVKNRPEGLMVIQGATFNAERELNWIEAPDYFFPAKLGESDFLQSIKESDSKKITTWDPASTMTFQFMKYKIADGRLTFWFLDKDAVKKAIQDGELKGIVKENNTITSPEVTLTESTEGLRRYFSAGGSKAIFSDKTKWTLEKVK